MDFLEILKIVKESETGPEGHFIQFLMSAWIIWELRGVRKAMHSHSKRIRRLEVAAVIPDPVIIRDIRS